MNDRAMSFRLSRSSETAIGEHIGKPLLENMKKSLARKSEIENGEELTRLISLNIEGRPRSNAFLEVQCDFELSNELRDALWY